MWKQKFFDRNNGIMIDDVVDFLNDNKAINFNILEKNDDEFWVIYQEEDI